MKNLCFLVFIFVFASEAYAISYLINPRVCVSRLKWNSDFTRAECKIRNGPFSNNRGRTEISFAIPAGIGQTRVEISIRPLSNGYVVHLNASEPVFPKQIEPLLVWTLAISAEQGIEAPQGVCAKLMAEVHGMLGE